MALEISISRNDDDETVDFHAPWDGPDAARAAAKREASKNVPFAEIRTEIERLRSLGFEVVCVRATARKLAEKGVRLDDVQSPTTR